MEEKIPKRKHSRLWRPLFFSFFSLLFLIFILLVFLFTFRLPIFHRAVQELGRRQGIEIEMRRVRGSLFSDLSVSDLRISFPNGTTFTTRSLKVRYNPIALLRRREITFLFLEEPEILIPKIKEKDFSTPTSPKPFSFPFRIDKVFIKSGKIPFLTKLGSFDFTGKIFFDTMGIRIGEGRITTEQGKADFALDYNLISQEGNLDITSLTFAFGDKPWFYSAEGNLVGKFAFSFQKKGIMGMPKINGRIKISLSSFSYKNFSITPCSLELNFLDTILSYQMQISSRELGFLRSEGFINFDTTYNFYLSFSIFHLKKFGDLLKINIPFSKVSGNLAIKGKGKREVIFSSNFQSLDLGDFNFQVSGKVITPFEKKGLVVIKEGKINRRRGAISFAGRFGREEIALNFSADSFTLKKGEIPFGFLREITTKINGFGEIRGRIDSLALKSYLIFSSFAWTNLSIGLFSLDLDFSNIFSLSGEGKTKWQMIKWGKTLFDSLGLFWCERNISLSIFKSKDTTFKVGLRVESLSFPNFSLLFNQFHLRLGEDSIFNLSHFMIEKIGDSLFLRDWAIQIGGGKVNGNLILLPDKYLRGELVISDLALEKLMKKEKVKGVVNGFVSLETVVVSQIIIKELTLPDEGIKINELKVEVRLENDILNFRESQKLQLTNVSFTNQDKVSHLSGYIVFSQGKIENWDISATLNDPGPWVFSFLKKTLHLQEGKIFGKVNLKGNFFNPIFDGRVRINNGKLFFPAFNLLVNKFSCELSLFQDEIILLEGKGKVDKGEITGSGFVNLKGFTGIDTLHYDVEVSEIPISLEKDIFGIFAGKVAIDWSPLFPLRLSGSLSVLEGLIQIPFGRKVSRGTGRGKVDFDFRIEGGKGIWLRNQNADLELGIDLRVKKEGEEMLLIGELITKRGQLYYLDRVLEMKEGKIIFDNISEIDPRLDIRAELETKPIKVGEDLPQRFKIIFLLQGTISQPEFKLFSEPPLLSENSIITYLTLNVAPEELKTISEREFFYSVLSERILSYFEREVAKKMRSYLSLDYLSLEQGLTEKGAKITVGKYVARNLYLTYSAVVGGEERDEYRAEYYLTRNHLLSAGKTAEGKYIVKYQFQIRY